MIRHCDFFEVLDVSAIKMTGVPVYYTLKTPIFTTTTQPHWTLPMTYAWLICCQLCSLHASRSYSTSCRAKLTIDSCSSISKTPLSLSMSWRILCLIPSCIYQTYTIPVKLDWMVLLSKISQKDEQIWYWSISHCRSVTLNLAMHRLAQSLDHTMSFNCTLTHKHNRKFHFCFYLFDIWHWWCSVLTCLHRAPSAYYYTIYHWQVHLYRKSGNAT